MACSLANHSDIAPAIIGVADIQVPQAEGHGGHDEEGERCAAKTEDLDIRSKRLLKIEGRDYLNLPFGQFYHNSAMIAAVAYMCLEVPLLFLPRPVATYVNTYNIALFFGDSVFFAGITAHSGVGPRWLWILQICLSVLVALACSILLDFPSLGYVLVSLLIMLAAARLWKQRCLVGVIHIVYLPVMWSFFIGFSYLSTIMSMIQVKWLETALFPVANLIFGLVMPTLLILAVERSARPGLNPYFLATAFAWATTGTEALRLAGILTSVNDLVALVQIIVMGVTLDIIGRLPILECLYGVCGWELLIDPSRDLYFRVRFSMSYLALVPALVITAFAAAAGSPWARRARTWMALLAYSFSGVACDIAIVTLHRRYCPISGETLRDTWARLAAQPRAHYPVFQPKVTVPPEATLWAPSSIHRPPIFSDAFWHAFSARVLAYIFTGSVMSAIYGTCYIWWTKEC